MSYRTVGDLFRLTAGQYASTVQQHILHQANRLALSMRGWRRLPRGSGRIRSEPSGSDAVLGGCLVAV